VALDYLLEAARAINPGVTMEMGRKSLGALGLVGPTALRRIGQLSGGEKARVALATFSLNPYNVLLLDEASNHLDAQTIEVLTGALQVRGWGGGGGRGGVRWWRGEQGAAWCRARQACS
jgi:ATPase subunit of ABC transporter with duplicated ATPase domains